MTTYSQRGIHKIYNKNITRKYFLRRLAYQLYKHMYASVAGRHTLWRKEQRCPPAQFCVRGICIITNIADFIQYLLQTPQTIFHLTYHCAFIKISPQFSLLAAIHLFISYHDEIEDFCSMDKKTGRRYVRLVRLATIANVHVRIVPPYMNFVVMTTYNQRCVSKIYFQNIMRNVTRTDKFLNYIQSQTHP